MRQFATFVSLMGVIWATAAAFKHRLAWVFCAALVCQSVFALCGWWLEQRVAHTDRAYMFFFSTFGLVLILAICCALSAPMPRWIGLMGIVSLIAALFFMGLRIYEALSRSGPVRTQIILCLVNGGVLLFCGILALLSLTESLSPDRRKATLCLGAFWLLQGAWGWVMAGTRGKVQVGDVDLDYYVGQFIAIVCFAGLACLLSGAQPESARQHARDEVAMTELQHVEVSQ